jgi:hypothetical protein
MGHEDAEAVDAQAALKGVGNHRSSHYPPAVEDIESRLQVGHSVCLVFTLEKKEAVWEIQNVPWLCRAKSNTSRCVEQA